MIQTRSPARKTAVAIRPFERGDVGAVLVLMRALAVFEGYADKFSVTEADIVEHGLGPSPCFGVFVADVGGAIVGIAVHYLIPWTYDLKPVVWLKELYVAETARGMSVGHALVKRLRDHAIGIGASAIKWTVLRSNLPAKAFYRSLDGRADEIWESWQMTIDA
ncbi:GNAT family N-acetyltransferase [Mesorhizobium sp. NZP2077]|uniref:GNAT family N-acetyltransferase n=1 Tax=Mesorhizobium sp. NZP2077 TaxID=2483404 RepID=UPI0015544958|nr:GNAT family N-acetyltransferase [Mesorhizobium sp. NZP2077]QKC81347.1 GNAT family N-acetyltransferase [Mesorhizobium sp. NZP2077]QKD14783.1 GNAT family N-acetyltransferase [Mesorhizobium sp. NZP2077]